MRFTGTGRDRTRRSWAAPVPVSRVGARSTVASTILPAQRLTMSNDCPLNPAHQLGGRWVYVFACSAKLPAQALNPARLIFDYLSSTAAPINSRRDTAPRDKDHSTRHAVVAARDGTQRCQPSLDMPQLSPRLQPSGDPRRGCCSASSSGFVAPAWTSTLYLSVLDSGPAWRGPSRPSARRSRPPSVGLRPRARRHQALPTWRACFK